MRSQVSAQSCCCLGYLPTKQSVPKMGNDCRLLLDDHYVPRNIDGLGTMPIAEDNLHFAILEFWVV